MTGTQSPLSTLFFFSLSLSLRVENVVRAVERDPGSCRGLPVPVQHKPVSSPSTSQRVGHCHEAPGSGHGEAAPGSVQLPSSDLPETVRAGPLL